MKMKKILALLLTVAMVAGFASCNGGGETKPETSGETSTSTTEGGTPEAPAEDGFNLAVNLASEPNSIDPALNTAVDGSIMILHAFEGLMKWKDDGSGNAVLTEGQAASYEKSEPAADGTIVYTLKLRDGIKWSDDKDVTAEDFVYSLQRLVDPATASEYNYMIDMVVNAKDIREGKKDKAELGVKAVDSKTLEITLTYDCPYFAEVLAFPALMPVRQDTIEANADQWTFEPATYISNGPMVMSEWVHNDSITMVPNEKYYDRASVTVDSLKFRLMDDFNAMLSGFRNGDLDFIEEMPVDEIPALKESGELTVVPYVGTYYVCFNNSVEPFNDAKVREALSLVIDRNYIVNEVTQTGEVAANGFVPAGVNDAEGAGGKDFRTTGGEYYSISEADYKANCDKARTLLAEAGYPEGKGFPIVEYLYNTNERHKVIGEALQNMWQTELGITVTLNNQDWAVFIDNRQEGNYQIARHGWIADYNDPVSFLDLWLTGGGNNNAQYTNPAYDEAMARATATSDPAERMKAMHEAEDILMGQDKAIAPVYFYTQKYMLNPNVEGMYYTPLGYFFFMNCKEKAQ